jgi:hypothetical protein
LNWSNLAILENNSNCCIKNFRKPCSFTIFAIVSRIILAYTQVVIGLFLKFNERVVESMIEIEDLFQKSWTYWWQIDFWWTPNNLLLKSLVKSYSLSYSSFEFYIHLPIYHYICRIHQCWDVCKKTRNKQPYLYFEL